MPDAHVTTEELARHLGVTPQRVNQYAAEGMPKGGRNDFDLHAACRWVREYERKLQAAEAAKKYDAKDFLAQQARLTKLKADLAEDRLARERAELIPAGQIMPLIERIFTSFKDNLLSMPAKVAPFVTGRPPAEVRDIIDREIRARLTELSTAAIRTVDLRGHEPTGDEDLPPGGPAAPPDPEPVGRRKAGDKSRSKSHGTRKLAHRAR